MGVRTAYVFGSFARGGAQDASDLDIAVLMPEPWDTHDSFTLAARIETAITGIVHRPVDVMVLNDACPLARFEAACRGVPIHTSDDEERIRYELRVRGQYEDYVHIQSFFVDALRERLGAGPTEG